jgi:ferritin
LAQTLIGASVFEQELFDHVSSHAEKEMDSLQAYEGLAGSTDSQAFAFLAHMILRDERQHHQMLQDMAKAIRVAAEMRSETMPVPYLDLHKDSQSILDATERLLAVEKQDQKDLKRLARELKDFKDTTLWNLMVGIMEADNTKHRMILKFIRDHAHPMV